MTTAGDGERPVVRVVRGEPSEVEVAALVAAVRVVAAGAELAGGPAGEPQARSRWAERSALVRRPLRHGPGAWRASAF